MLSLLRWQKIMFLMKDPFKGILVWKIIKKKSREKPWICAQKNYQRGMTNKNVHIQCLTMRNILGLLTKLEVPSRIIKKNIVQSQDIVTQWIFLK